MSARPGLPFPLGVTVLPSPSDALTLNFAIHSTVPLSLLIFPPRPSPREVKETITLTRTGAILHAEALAPRHASYAFRAADDDRLLLDPRAKWIESRSASSWGVSGAEPLALVEAPPDAAAFDWGCDERPMRSPGGDVIYEASVRGLGGGGFVDVVERLDYLRGLGVTALELLPCGEFDENEVPGERVNVWGYMPVQPAMFALMGRYGRTPTSAPVEFKTLVKALHSRGMECLLDVVYNHVAGPSCSLHFLGVNSDYFITDGGGHHSNISGCGNTLSPNSPPSMALILDSLRWLVAEYRVDGFRFDAAGVLARRPNGSPSSDPSALLLAIAGDPLLADRKIIVEPWDAGDGVSSPNYLNGHYPLRTALEWNPDHGRALRRFLFHGGSENARAFAKALRGHRLLFASRPYGAAHSVNYISCHDGFALADYISFNSRTNADGYDDDTSFNHGHEGPTTDPTTTALRLAQARNLTLALALSRGTPMISMGCEAGLSKGGNNNCYDVDGDANRLPADVDAAPLTAFTRAALALRKYEPCLDGTDFYDTPESTLVWVDARGEKRGAKKIRRGRAAKRDGANDKTGDVGGLANQCESDSLVCWTVGELYCMFYAGKEAIAVTLPRVEEGGRLWTLVCDTRAESGDYFAKNDAAEVVKHGGSVSVVGKSARVYRLT